MKNTLHNRKALKPIRQSLRNDATAAEKLLWECLRKSKVGDKKFRRQHSIGKYIVDFYCPESRLIIEVDGSIHELENVKRYDREREDHLRDMDFKIVRVTNDEIFEDLDRVIEKIKLFL